MNTTALENILLLPSEAEDVHTMWSNNLTPRLVLLFVPGTMYKNVQNSPLCNSIKPGNKFKCLSTAEWTNKLW